jgi:hypothetical protein
MATTELADVNRHSASGLLPQPGALLTFAVLLPAAVAATNQVLFELVPSYPSLRTWLYPWMAASTAVLSWCAGRYLFPIWLRCTVFAWCLALLDTLTIAACFGRGVDNHFGYALVASQVSLIVLWAILADANWQWRLPIVLVTASAVIVFSGSFDDSWNARHWNLLIIVTALVVALVCGLLRWRKFTLRHADKESIGPRDNESLRTHQFGLKHMLLWATAMVPILVVVRGLDFLLFKRLGGSDLLPFALVALSVASVNLIAIWAVLGKGLVIARVAALVVLPYLLAMGLRSYLQHIESTYKTWRIGTSGQNYQIWSNAWFDSLINGIFDANDNSVSWLWLNAALLAALLLFLRASGYRLARKDHSLARVSDS